MANDMNRLIDMMYERIEDAKSPALKPNLSMVDRDEMLDLLDEEIKHTDSGLDIIIHITSPKEKAEPENTVEVIALGPLTNLAVAIRLAPETMKRVKRISVMGSAGLGTGNVTPASEFNIWQDPESAKIVVESGLPMMFVGWDACLDDAMLSAADIERIRSSGELGKFAIDCNKCLMEMNCGRFGEPCLDMADPAAMAAALCPECIEKCDKYYCEVDISFGISAGAVLVDIYQFSGKEPNVWICSKLKPQVYKDYIFRTLHA